ncbi:MAG: glycosyl transferase family 36 [Bacteroidetes bacterium]|nr:glycosyl transferase family 36 [Bacteroidota bacterium]
MKFKNQYGYFTDDYREFVITNPETPRPWFNYMWNERYAGLVSHGGGGFSFVDTPRDNRISRMRYNCQPWDRPGRYVLLRDAETGEYWSLSWAPTTDRKYDFYEARIGQGYTRITTEYEGIRATLTYFVPRNTLAEVWYVQLQNLSGRPRNIQVFAFQELMMGNALNDIINQPNDKHFTDIRFNREKQTLEATRRYWVLNKKAATVEQPNIDWRYKVYFSLSLPVESFDGSLDTFTGRWRSEANPIAVERGSCFDTEITAGDPVVALQSRLQLDPDSSFSFAVLLGVASKDDPEPYRTLQLEQFRDMHFVEQQFDAVRKYWDNYLGHVQVQTPDDSVNLMLNVWNQYQSAVTFDMARNSGYYHGGLLFGTGMRDQFQDILGMVIVEPARVRQRMLNAMQFQFKDGSTLHNFFKLTNHGERTHHSDTPLWISFGLVEYLNETHDFSILDEVVPFYDEGEATVLEHMIRSLDFAISECTERGLPRIRKGDWNDTLDHIGPQGKGETIWGAFFLCYALEKTFELINHLGLKDVYTRWKSAYDRIASVVNEIAWDGEWYVRAFRDNGKVVGSATMQQGKLFLNSQSWAVLSGVAPRERAEQALNSCLRHLENKTGMQLVWPAYREVEDDIGLISRCVPGKKENGAVFNHASSWFVLAALMHGKTDEALRIYRKMLPVNSSAAVGIDRYETEPYVFSEYVTSREHETEGQASHSWLTGTSVWMYRIGLDHILGLRTSLRGITVNPNIPADWNEIKINRKYMGKTIAVHVLNPERRGKGVKHLRINGAEAEPGSWILPSDYLGERIEVEVVLG